jgi:hypothetical protein
MLLFSRAFHERGTLGDDGAPITTVIGRATAKLPPGPGDGAP